MSLFTGVGSAKMSEGLPKLTAGTYRMQIDRCIAKALFKGGNGFIVESTVVATSDPVNHPIGAKRGWIQKLDKVMALGTLKQFGAAVLGVDPKDQAAVEARISPTIQADLDKAVSPSENGFAGLFFDVQVDKSKTQPQLVNGQMVEGHDWDKHTFSPVPEAELAKLLAGG